MRTFAPPEPSVSGAVPMAGQWQVSTEGGETPAWSRDGQELYYVAPDLTMMAVSVTLEGAVPSLGPPVAVFPTRIVRHAGRSFDVGPDGRFLINTRPDDVATTPITLIQNWRAE